MPHRIHAPVTAAYSQEDANDSKAIRFAGSFIKACIFGVPVDQVELETVTSNTCLGSSF